MSLRLVSKRKILWASLAGSAGTSAALVGLFFMLLGLNLHTYTKLTAERVLAKVIVGEKSELGRALMLRIDGKQPIRLDMPGEEWQLDGRFLKWKAWAALLGKTPNVRLERFSSRREKNAQVASEPVIIELIESPGAWISAAMTIAEQLGMVDAYYGSSVYMPLAEGAEFIVSATMSGLGNGYYVSVDPGELGLPGRRDRPVFSPCGVLGDGLADEESPGDPGLDDGDQSQTAATRPERSVLKLMCT